MARGDDTSTRASDSSRKVARAAKAGQAGGTTGREQRELGFPLALAGVIIAGLALVAFSWNARDVAALSPSFNDHWHVAYGIYDCRTDSFLPNLADPRTPNSGIHTHGDGAVHIHPSSSEATGNNAQLKRFFEATRVELTDDTMSFADRDSIEEEGAECDGKPAILQVVRFAPGSDTPDTVITEDLDEYRFLADQERVVIALAPIGADIPPPPQANIDAAAASSPFILETDQFPEDFDLSELEGLGDIEVEDDGSILDEDGNVVVPAPDETDSGESDTSDTESGDAETDEGG